MSFGEGDYMDYAVPQPPSRGYIGVPIANPGGQRAVTCRVAKATKGYLFESVKVEARSEEEQARFREQLALGGGRVDMELPPTVRAVTRAVAGLDELVGLVIEAMAAAPPPYATRPGDSLTRHCAVVVDVYRYDRGYAVAVSKAHEPSETGDYQANEWRQLVTAVMAEVGQRLPPRVQEVYAFKELDEVVNYLRATL